MPRRLLCALFLSVGTLFAQTVEGTVTNTATGSGIPSVAVTLARNGHTEYSAKTDDHGKFQIPGVRDGNYSAKFDSPRFVSFRNANGRPFVVQPGSGPVRLDGEMIPLGRISGRVIDGRGDPVPHATMELSTAAGSYLFWSTDAKGNFTWDQFLLPGSYMLSAGAPSDWKPPAPDGDLVFAWARTYYSGSVRFEDASKFVLPPGTELTNLEIKLAAASAHHVRGTIFDTDGKPRGGAAVRLGEGHPFAPRSTRANENGEFDFRGVVDGEWHLMADSISDGVQLEAKEWIRMDGHEVKDVQLRFNPPFSMTGRVILEDSNGAGAQLPPAPAFVPHGDPDFLGEHPSGQYARPNEDGMFTVTGLYPGPYRVIPGSPRSPYYLDSIRLGDREIRGQEVDLPSAARLTLIYKPDGGGIRGTVEACGTGSVLLLPQDSEMRRAGYVRSEQCTANGHFEISAIKPGDYYAVAVPSVPSAIFRMLVKLDPALLAQAARVTVRTGESTQLDLRVTTTAYE